MAPSSPQTAYSVSNLLTEMCFHNFLLLLAQQTQNSPEGGSWILFLPVNQQNCSLNSSWLHWRKPTDSNRVAQVLPRIQSGLQNTKLQKS